MRRKILLPLILIMLVAYGGLAATLIAGNSPELGLDLQGGVSVVLAPTSEASGEQLDQAVSIIRNRVDALGVAEPEITRQGDAIVVQLPGVKNRDRALELVGQTAELEFRTVLQSSPISKKAYEDWLAGGNGVVDTTTTTAPGDTTATTAPADPSATTTTAPPATTGTSEGALGLVPGESAAAPQQDPTSEPTCDTTALQSQEGLTPRDQDDPNAAVILPGKSGDDAFSAYVMCPAQASGRIVRTASAELQQNGQWVVALKMHGGDNGIDKFNEIAAQCFGGANPTTCPADPQSGEQNGRVAIVLDGVVQSAPAINEQSFSPDQIQISGAFTQSDAKNLALVLRYGALPVELERQDVTTVSASLGEDSLRAGIIAGIVGLALVALYMLLYYRALGIVVIVGLTVWGSLMYTIVSFLGVTQGLALTLAGVTGIIVSIGVTVDSYVVFFERLKDEVKAGRTLRSSGERAFKRAFRTILAADFSAFLGAAVLWWLTVGSVRGFAFFLGLSTVLDMVVAWSFTRPAVIILSQNRVFTEMPVLGVARGLAVEEQQPATREPATTAGAGR
jgi:preprotein translocase subunit SecD